MRSKGGGGPCCGFSIDEPGSRLKSPRREICDRCQGAWNSPGRSPLGRTVSFRRIRLADDLPFAVLLHQVEEVGEIRIEEAFFFQDGTGDVPNHFDGGND